MIFPLIFPLLFPLWPLAIMAGLMINDPIMFKKNEPTKQERIMIFTPYVNVGYLLYQFAKRAKLYIETGE